MRAIRCRSLGKAFAALAFAQGHLSTNVCFIQKDTAFQYGYNSVHQKVICLAKNDSPRLVHLKLLVHYRILIKSAWDENQVFLVIFYLVDYFKYSYLQTLWEPFNFLYLNLSLAKVGYWSTKCFPLHLLRTNHHQSRHLCFHGRQVLPLWPHVRIVNRMVHILSLPSRYNPMSRTLIR